MFSPGKAADAHSTSTMAVSASRGRDSLEAAGPVSRLESGGGGGSRSEMSLMGLEGG